ncbi:agmatinase [bacterium]|nr:agmatinase [candidate division CSSED10-310 bacterium]
MQFLDYPIQDINYENAKVVITPVPFEASVSYGKGTAGGPSAILEASSQVELFDTFFKRECSAGEIYTTSEIDTISGYPQMAETLKNHVVKLLSDNKFPVILGGEHALSIPVAEAFFSRYPEGTIIHFDAHADLRHEYNANPYSHACTLKRIWELGCPTISIGIRSMSREEWDFAIQQNIILLSPEDTTFWESLRITLADKSGPAWLTFDVDGMDPSIMPATGTPEPGGFSWDETMRILMILSQSHLQFAGCDVVEFAPINGFHAADFTMAKLVYRIILALAIH